MSTRKKSAIRPGSRVRGSRSGRPIMAAFDLLGRRWALRILWELRETPASFRELRARCDDVSPSVLNTRLAELRDTGIVDATDAGYELTRLGTSLIGALEPLHTWAGRWHAELERTK